MDGMLHISSPSFRFIPLFQHFTGLHRNQFLALTSSNDVTIKDHPEGGAYTDDILFSVDEYSVTKL
jgi:hypothetical protein